MFLGRVNSSLVSFESLLREACNCSQTTPCSWLSSCGMRHASRSMSEFASRLFMANSIAWATIRKLLKLARPRHPLPRSRHQYTPTYSIFTGYCVAHPSWEGTSTLHDRHSKRLSANVRTHTLLAMARIRPPRASATKTHVQTSPSGNYTFFLNWTGHMTSRPPRMSFTERSVPVPGPRSW